MNCQQSKYSHACSVRVGVCSWPTFAEATVDGYSGGFCAVTVCGDEQHQRNARAYVLRQTGHDGIIQLDGER